MEVKAALKAAAVVWSAAATAAAASAVAAASAALSWSWMLALWAALAAELALWAELLLWAELCSASKPAVIDRVVDPLVLLKMAPELDVIETVPVPALIVPTPMLPPALIVMLPPVVVRLPRSATSYAAIVIVPAASIVSSVFSKRDWPRRRNEYQVAWDVDRAGLAACAQVLNFDGPANERAASLQLTGSELQQGVRG